MRPQNPSGSDKPKSKNRILLDRSTFTTASRYEKLKSVLAAVLPQNAEVLVTPRLLSETLAVWHDNPRSAEAREHLQFILRIGNPRWFNEPVEIAKLELCAHTLPDKYYFFPPSIQRSLEQNIKALIGGGTARPEVMQRVRLGVQKDRERANKLRKRGVKIQYEEPRKFKIENPGKKPSEVNVKDAWDFELRTRLARVGEDAIVQKRIYQAGRRGIALKTWTGHKERCPFFTAWVQGILYSDFYAAHYPNSAIDKHAQADIEHLLYLEQADVLVSEDRKFMRQAFLDLYKERGKQYWTLDELDQWARERSVKVEQVHELSYRTYISA